MGERTGIEWTDATWNPVAGCSIVSPGCTNCYAMKMAARIERMGTAPHYAGLTQPSKAGPVWTGKVATAPDHILTQPMRWKKPRRIFVNSMSDLFHEAVPDETIDRVFAVMALCPQHTFQVLTKRAARMRDYCTRLDNEPVRDTVRRIVAAWPGNAPIPHEIVFPPPNVWLGVSAEDQTRADERIPDLLAIPAAVRFVSCEPLLGPLSFRWPAWHAWAKGGKTDHLDGLRRLDWIIVGGESGPGARAHWVPNTRAIVEQCRQAGVACYVKQMGSNVQDRNDAGFDGDDYGMTGWHLDDEVAQVEHDVDGYADDAQGAPCRIRLRDRKGGDMSEWPRDLRVREFPT